MLFLGSRLHDCDYKHDRSPIANIVLHINSYSSLRACSDGPRHCQCSEYCPGSNQAQDKVCSELGLNHSFSITWASSTIYNWLVATLLDMAEKLTLNEFPNHHIQLFCFSGWSSQTTSHHSKTGSNHQRTRGMF